MYAAGISTGFVPLAAEFKVPLTKLVDLISYSVLALGVSNLFWMPLAICIGKRPVILISILVCLAGCIWSIKARNFNSLLGARILCTFGMIAFP
jgi:predicted MFS family arabinose efflux permease